jgi:hypothetical protein
MTQHGLLQAGSSLTCASSGLPCSAAWPAASSAACCPGICRTWRCMLCAAACDDNSSMPAGVPASTHLPACCSWATLLSGHHSHRPAGGPLSLEILRPQPSIHSHPLSMPQLVSGCVAVHTYCTALCVLSHSRSERCHPPNNRFIILHVL